MEAGKPHTLLIPSWKTRKASGITPSTRPKCHILMSQEPWTSMVRASPFLCLSVLLGPSELADAIPRECGANLSQSTDSPTESKAKSLPETLTDLPRNKSFIIIWTSLGPEKRLVEMSYHICLALGNNQLSRCCLSKGLIYFLLYSKYKMFTDTDITISFHHFPEK